MMFGVVHKNGHVYEVKGKCDFHWRESSRCCTVDVASANSMRPNRDYWPLVSVNGSFFADTPVPVNHIHIGLY